jgi:hypothetical protein
MTNPENMGSQFDSIISANFSKCPGCQTNYVTEASPVSTVDDKTKICENCSVGEKGRAIVMNMDPAVNTLDNSGSVENLISSYHAAKSLDRVQKEEANKADLHESRIRNASVPIPEPTKLGKWNIEYGKNRHTGDIEAYATHPNSGLAHDAILHSDSGEVSFGLRDTYVPPESVQKHIKNVLGKHYVKHIKGD